MNFITPAFAQSAAAPSGSEFLTQMVIPIVFVLAITYFLMIRPQQQRAKEAQKMIDSIRRGDVVVTTGGLIGKVTKALDGPEIEVEIAPNVRVRVLRQMVGEVRSKGEPVKDTSATSSPA